MTSVTVYVGPQGDPMSIPDTCPDDEGGIAWNGMTFPEWEYRYATAPPSNWVPGNILLAAVPDSSAVPLSVIVRGDSLSDLEVRKAELAEALSAWPGEFRVDATNGGTVTIAGPWATFPTIPRWGDVNVTLLGFHVVEGTFALPVNPQGAP